MQQSSITNFFKTHHSTRHDQRPTTNRQDRRPPPYRSRDSISTPSTPGQHRGGKSPRNTELKKVAQETKNVLPAVLKSLPGFGADVSAVYDLDGVVPLNAARCPGYALPSDDDDAGRSGTRIRVLDRDSFDAAIELQPAYTAQIHLSSLPAATRSAHDIETPASSATEDADMDLDGLPVPPPQPAAPSWDLSRAPPQNPPPERHPPTAKPHTIAPFPHSTPSPVVVLNLASERHAGGGWTNGAMAQEESLCYRSSLYRSLHKAFYPLASLSAIYTPSVLIIRSATTAGHALYAAPAPQLPVTSVISIAALRHPPLTRSSSGATFANPAQRAETRRKIRLSLRLAATMGHGKLVLGALGCGVFANPPTEVAHCFLDVFRETEFSGGWWEEVVFAVLDSKSGAEAGKDGSGNYGQFYRVLHGQIV